MTINKKYTKSLEAQIEKLQEKLALSEQKLQERSQEEELAIWLYQTFVGGLVYEMKRKTPKKINTDKMIRLCHKRLEEITCGASASFYKKQIKAPEHWKEFMDIIVKCIQLNKLQDDTFAEKFNF